MAPIKVHFEYISLYVINFMLQLETIEAERIAVEQVIKSSIADTESAGNSGILNV